MVVTVPEILEPIRVVLKAVDNPRGGETAQAWRFAATVAQLKGRRSFNGSVTSVTIGGRVFTRVQFAFHQ
jgi:hypothetical protein